MRWFNERSQGINIQAGFTTSKLKQTWMGLRLLSLIFSGQSNTKATINFSSLPSHAWLVSFPLNALKERTHSPYKMVHRESNWCVASIDTFGIFIEKNLLKKVSADQVFKIWY